MLAPKLIAFLLPQFHRIAENDEWWGPGFTEWTNVTRARAQFVGHRQPRVPLGGNYYDLTRPETRAWQAELARTHGLHGFCYYHYWFSGRRLLETPFDAVLESKTPDFPFCLAWANEPWTRTWDGGDAHVLMPQSYGGEAEWVYHFDYLEKAFRDPRYIRVDGKPVFVLYRSASIADCEAMLACWRRLALERGFPGLHLVSMLTVFESDRRRSLFDAFIEFEPNYSQHRLPRHWKLYERAINAASRLSWRRLGKSFCAPHSRDYRVLWRVISRRRHPPNVYPGAFVDWDNSPRKALSSSLVLRSVSVSTFKRGLARLYRNARADRSAFIFINAWNEWAEGTYLEPDEHHGLAYLEAIRDVVGAEVPELQIVTA